MVDQYKPVSLNVADEIAKATPLLASQLRFVDRSTVDLGRLKSELKSEGKNASAASIFSGAATC